MPSLNQILREHSPLLLLDASSGTVQVGVLRAGVPAAWARRTEEAGVGLFQALEELNVDVASIGAFAFCEGPGSILGARTCAMALRAWNAISPRPTYAYFGLSVVFAGLGRPGASVIADARRGLWHRVSAGAAPERLPAEALTGELVTPEGYRHWDRLPEGTVTVPYSLADLFGLPRVSSAEVFRTTDAPDAFLHAEPTYAKWVPQIHRAP